ncbi:KamA family radical SAM protein [bacterium]|nr:KamA family radical SAM protein [candidate division CSSED10-310 bacterium]
MNMHEVSLNEIGRTLNLTADDMEPLEQAHVRFPVRITPGLLARIDPSDPLDPIRRQFIPSPEELIRADHESADPLNETKSSPVSGLIHKYPGRVLILTSCRCPVHCRFCFRKTNLPRSLTGLSGSELDRIADYIRNDCSIHEAIFSGGDPLMCSDPELGALVELMSTIPHIETVRVHTRVPVVWPERITDGLVRILTSGKPLWVVLHINHSLELDDSSRDAIRRLADTGIPLLNQAVLLRGVNDDAAVLADLSRTLIRNRVHPYYIHFLDPVLGTAHFAVSLAKARRLIRILREILPGFAVPRLVRDLPGKHSKTEHLKEC